VNTFSMLFVSDLYRTRQTLDAMQAKWNTSMNPVILPCASEVAGVGTNGDCDSSISATKKMARENYSSCTTQQVNTALKTDRCAGEWSVYLDFYGQKMRGQDDTFTGFMSRAFRPSTRMHCRNTTLLALAIYCLDFSTSTLTQFMGNPSGGTKRKRKRRLKYTVKYGL